MDRPLVLDALLGVLKTNRDAKIVKTCCGWLTGWGNHYPPVISFLETQLSELDWAEHHILLAETLLTLQSESPVALATLLKELEPRQSDFQRRLQALRTKDLITYQNQVCCGCAV